ncbi:MAG: DeoR/GlpR transcriptional regulator [Lachnospiraceae bacterium]|nr:DeoR/GlpR transcriptional regulator [Lachnospiraceae bacterium]MCI8996648.1 DeoR/GlpR transcriptional regulator [Lachnospiraceae bacterium]MCI9135081.1 DeoR/GlpR transcriptional regulator [Lachnospiraceae bacterium]
MNQIRRESIGKYIQEKGAVTVKEISALFPDVSLMTIHRDLERLEEGGLIVRTRGGAMPVSQSNGTEAKLETRMQSNMRSKRQMAKKALSLIDERSAVFFDAGTSNMALAQVLPDVDLNIFTTGPNIALELSRLTNPTVHMCGGTLNRSNQAVSGASTIAMLEDINIATAFVGVSGYTPEGGFTCGKEDEMLVKRLVMRKAARKVILMDSSKYGKILPYTFGSVEDADYVISDGGLPEEFMQRAKQAGVAVL